MRIRSRSIQNKILIAILLVTVIAAAAITAVFYASSYDVIEENYSQELLSKEKFVIESFDREMMQAYMIGVNAACDETMTEAAAQYEATSDEVFLTDIARQLRSFASHDRMLASVYLYLTESDILVTSREYPVYKKNIEKAYPDLMAGIRSKTSVPVILEAIGDSGSHTLSYIIPVNEGRYTVSGYIFVNLDCERLYYDFISDTISDIDEEAVLLNGEKVIASANGEKAGARYSGYQNIIKWMRSDDIAGADGEHVYVYSKGSFSGCSIFVKAGKKEILADMTKMWGYMIIIMLAVLCCSVALAMYVSRKICGPLRELTMTMRAASQGELQIRADLDTADEIGELADDFNHMLDETEILIGQLIGEEKQKKNAELEALQYQITPHFMYNTLNSIRSAALIKGEKELGKVLGDFVELLQASVNKKGKVYVLKEEIQLLKKYISIQEFRYGSGISAECDISDEAGECMVPRLILQPLVENALIHGMDLKDDGRLMVSAVCEDGKLCMKVADNGRGMSREEIEQLINSREKKTSGMTAVGIPNIIDRLKLYYGDEAELSYESDSYGTTAIIVMPQISDRNLQ